MAIDILNIEPSVISRDLKGKYVLVYSQPKVGKTSFAASFPKNLLMAFEKGYVRFRNQECKSVFFDLMKYNMFN